MHDYPPFDAPLEMRNHDLSPAYERLHGQKVLILIGGHLATAPRPQKEASALRASWGCAILKLQSAMAQA